MAVEIQIAQKEHAKYAQDICQLIYTSALARGTGIAKRTPEYITDKIDSGKAIIALDGKHLVGFSYIETFSNNKFVTNSGLVVHPDYRNQGIARRIKKRIFEHARKLYPQAKIISITTGLAVMKMNTELGFKPVTFSELPADEEFWRGCAGCRNYDILQRNNNKMCLCTGLLFDPATKPKGVVKTVGSYTKKFVPIAKSMLKKDRS